ncbi:hypothetical protein D3C78_523320 [compost metagenome]
MVAGQGEELAGLAIGGQFRSEAGFVKALAQVLAGAGLVFDDQQFHAVSRMGAVMAEMIRDYPGLHPS